MLHKLHGGRAGTKRMSTKTANARSTSVIVKAEVRIEIFIVEEPKDRGANQREKSRQSENRKRRIQLF